MPDDIQAHLDSILGAQPTLFYSCFISYSGADKQFADQLYGDLRAHHVRCWYAPHDIRGGEKLHEQVLRAIRAHDKLLIVLSETSMSSEWVQTEIREARCEEVRSGVRKLFPISLLKYDDLLRWRCFDGDIGKDLAREIREYFIPDFSTWHDSQAYQANFARLLRDLIISRNPIV